MARATKDAPKAPAQEAENQNEGQRAQRPTSIRVDDSTASNSYTNFCRVTGTPEELVVDFGMNSQPLGNIEGAVHVNQRIIMNFYTAKRLLAALTAAVQRHEAVFGVLETDIQKRVRSDNGSAQ